MELINVSIYIILAIIMFVFSRRFERSKKDFKGRRNTRSFSKRRANGAPNKRTVVEENINEKKMCRKSWKKKEKRRNALCFPDVTTEGIFLDCREEEKKKKCGKPTKKKGKIRNALYFPDIITEGIILDCRELGETQVDSTDDPEPPFNCQENGITKEEDITKIHKDNASEDFLPRQIRSKTNAQISRYSKVCSINDPESICTLQRNGTTVSIVAESPNMEQDYMSKEYLTTLLSSKTNAKFICQTNPELSDDGEVSVNQHENKNRKTETATNINVQQDSVSEKCAQRLKSFEANTIFLFQTDVHPPDNPEPPVVHEENVPKGATTNNVEKDSMSKEPLPAPMNRKGYTQLLDKTNDELSHPREGFLNLQKNGNRMSQGHMNDNVKQDEWLLRNRQKYTQLSCEPTQEDRSALGLDAVKKNHDSTMTEKLKKAPYEYLKVSTSNSIPNDEIREECLQAQRNGFPDNFNCLRCKEEDIDFINFALDTNSLVSQMPNEFADQYVVVPPRMLRELCNQEEESKIITEPIIEQSSSGDKKKLQLYYQLQPYVLTARQLKANGFPLELPGKPGMAVFDYYTTDISDSKNRCCTRCKSVYSVTNEEGYKATNKCTYHPGRIWMTRTGRETSCCKNSFMGCVTEDYHVSSPRPLEAVKCVKTNDLNTEFSHEIYFLDCEMSFTLKGLEVTRISVLNSDCNIIYDTFVLPVNPIIDYNTRYSGITSKDLENVTVTLEDVQTVLLNFIHSKSIIVGHYNYRWSFTLKGLEVTRISVLNSDCNIIYDTFVLPVNPIIDYNTRYSGITSKDLENVTVTLEDVQTVLLNFIHSKSIIVGHGLDNDFRALQIIHGTVVDTSVVFPHHRGPPYKRSLKSLVECYLGKLIQQSKNGHDSVEDALACMELMQWKVKSDVRNM